MALNEKIYLMYCVNALLSSVVVNKENYLYVYVHVCVYARMRVLGYDSENIYIHLNINLLCLFLQFYILH